MGLLDFLRRKKEPAFGLSELARRLGMTGAELAAVEVRYHQFTIPKRRGGGRRTILAPDRPLKRLQRRILRRLLALLVSHPAVHGFERGRSIVTNARFHRARPIVVRLDIREFFTSTSAQRVERFFRRIGWSRPAARRLTELCTYQGGLPQGAPTSPRLANLINYRLDTRLDHLAVRMGAMYTRYADDLTFSFDQDTGGRARCLIRAVGRIVAAEGYRLHTRRKLSIRRRHQRQRVTGLVVNERINLPRETRRRLRAVEHHLTQGRKATLTEDQMRGWRALMTMVRRQAGPPEAL
jgi:retron-type reverse transcriptase